MNNSNLKDSFYYQGDLVLANMKEEALISYKELKTLKFYMKVNIETIEKQYSNLGVYTILFRFCQSHYVILSKCLMKFIIMKDFHLKI